MLIIPVRSKFGVYIPEDMVNELEKCMTTLGVRSKSALIRDALKLFITEHQWKSAKTAVGVIGVIYNHHAKMVDKQLTDIQHDYLDIIVSTLHVHLDKEKCMLAIVVKGDTERMRKLLGRLSTAKGVEIARPLLLAIE